MLTGIRFGNERRPRLPRPRLAKRRFGRRGRCAIVSAWTMGRVSMISTRSPLWDALVSSWAWQTVRRRSSLPYLGCGTSRSTTTRRVLLILSDATIPISVLRRPRGSVRLGAGFTGLAHRGLVKSVGTRSSRFGVKAWPPGLQLARSISRRRRMVLIRAISRLAFTISLGASSRSVSLCRCRRNRFVLHFLEQKLKLFVGLFAKLGRFGHGSLPL